MIRGNVILKLIIGIVAIGVLIALFILAWFLILPIIALIIIAVPIFIWLKSRPRKDKKGAFRQKSETVNRSRYDVLDVDENDTPHSDSQRNL